MKKKSKLKKLAAKYVNYSYQNGRGDEEKIKKIMEGLKSLPRSQAIYIISKFLKGVRKKEGENTLIIESAVLLSKRQIDQILKNFRKEFVITEVKNVINPSLLGGFRVRVGDMISDYSIQGNISRLKEAVSI